MFRMLVGISLISVVAEMFLSNTNFKKYIKAILGVFAFVIMLEGIFSVNLFFDTSVLDKAEKMADITISKAEKEIIATYEKNIKEELLKNNIEVIKVNVQCDSNLTLKKVIINLKDISQREKVNALLLEKFGLSGEILEIRGEG